ncbi:hypothetical protein IWW34DRAFT_884993 [Fusarium oxysporum f. sp. albedinis]|nr:hypothetical protein IWW34DRAFT_884993 [Fusarium oxysporum f. sp. albedinis]
MSEKQPRRRGRPKKIRTEEERLVAQRTHTRTYYDRLQQEDVGSVPYARFYQYAPHTSATSSTGPQLPACCTPPDSSAFLPSNDLENPDDGSDPFIVGSSTQGQIEVNYDDVGFCLSDTVSAISQASDAWEELDETCGLSLPDLSAEQARNHRQEQQDEGVKELLETFEKSLHISIPADTCQDEIDELHNDNELFGHDPQNLGARYDESSAPSLERYLAQEWTTQPSCSSEAHKADHENLANNECHRSCDSLDDVVARLDGLIDDDHSHDPLPYVTDPSSDLLNHASQSRTSPDSNPLPDLGQLTNPHRPDYRAACQIALEGTLGDGTPPNLCLPKRHSFDHPFTNDFIQKTYDIDSICSFPTSFAVAKLASRFRTTASLEPTVVYRKAIRRVGPCIMFQIIALGVSKG